MCKCFLVFMFAGVFFLEIVHLHAGLLLSYRAAMSVVSTTLTVALFIAYNVFIHAHTSTHSPLTPPYAPYTYV